MGRVEYVHQMEMSVEHMKRELAHYKGIAELWEPVFTTEMDPAKQQVKVGLRFGGKNVHATMSFSALQQTSLTDSVSQIVDALSESLVVEQLRKVAAPKLQEAITNALSIKSAGKW
jgi:hypothetical protein